MKQIKNKYFWTILLLSTWPLTFLAFAICGYFKLNYHVLCFLCHLGVYQGVIDIILLFCWSYPDGTIKEFLYEDAE